MGGRYNPRDHYFLLAKKKGYRARSAFKLLDIQEKFQVIRSGDHVLDLGAAPGGFLQVTTDLIGHRGRAIGIDLKPIDPLPFNNVTFQVADALAEDFPEILAEIHPKPFDVILSDMAPKTTGIADVDKTRSIVLAEEVLALSLKVLKPRGNMVIKVLEGRDYHGFLKDIKALFNKVNGFKTTATRKGSSEIFIVARGMKPQSDNGKEAEHEK